LKDLPHAKTLAALLIASKESEMGKDTKSSTPAQDEYFLDTPTLRAFIADVRRALAAHTVENDQGAELIDASVALDALQPRFAELLADQSWLPDEFAAPYAASGMGGGIGSWVLFRAGDRSLSLFSLVVPAGSETPIHDHLAWGFVGLYRGEQKETVYRREDEGESHHHEHNHHDPAATGEEPAVLTVAEVNHLKPGDFYKLIPPFGDIHAVKTTSLEPSISIHLLANDTGCVIRHSFDVERGVARSFRSGYSNVACDVDAADDKANGDS
jgi:predicted metal-dependent enzyme (double-stranded beta helix superfamily)